MPETSPPDVSVLVPALNEEDTIGEVVERLLRLPLKVQVIVIDDGSSDRTPEILRHYDLTRQIATRRRDEIVSPSFRSTGRHGQS